MCEVEWLWEATIVQWHWIISLLQTQLIIPFRFLSACQWILKPFILAHRGLRDWIILKHRRRLHHKYLFTFIFRLLTRSITLCCPFSGWEVLYCPWYWQLILIYFDITLISVGRVEAIAGLSLSDNEGSFDGNSTSSWRLIPQHWCFIATRIW